MIDSNLILVGINRMSPLSIGRIFYYSLHGKQVKLKEHFWQITSTVAFGKRVMGDGEYIIIFFEMGIYNH